MSYLHTYSMCLCTRGHIKFLRWKRVIKGGKFKKPSFTILSDQGMNVDEMEKSMELGN